MYKIFIAICALFFVSCLAQLSDVDISGGPAQLNDVVFIKSWNDQSTRGWSKSATTTSSSILAQSNFVSGYQGKKAFRFAATTTSNTQANLITTSFGNPNFIKGSRIRISAFAKATNVTAAAQANPVGGVAVRLAITYWPPVGSTGSSTATVQKTGVYGTFDWTSLDHEYQVTGNIQSINVTIGLFAATGTVLFDQISVTIIQAVPIIPANLLWTLTTHCSFGPGTVYPILDCTTTNIPIGYTVPNSFQIRIGNGPFGANVPASLCRVAYNSSDITVFCDGYSPNTNGPVYHPVYVRNYITQNWVLTNSTVFTQWVGV